MKTIRIWPPALILSVALAFTGFAAAPNAYDTVGKLLLPFISVIAQNSRSPNRALQMTLQLENTESAPKDAVGVPVQVSFQYPDKLKVSGTALGESVTICRNGQDLWASPGDKIQALLDATATDRKLPAPDPKYKLAPFQLPIPEKQLVFLPALFQARNAGQEEISGVACQVVDLQLMPELARALKEAQGWSARAWVTPEAKPARLLLTGPDQSVALRFTSVQFQRSLDPSTWQAAADAVKIPPSRYDQLIRAVMARK